jgi:NAD(P)-dependent dehydrogenase (short-subunit alcohol dehydrogenase family)
MKRMSGKVILVTGASGIAAAGARLFAAEGANVFVISRTGSKCEALVDEIVAAGAAASWASADLTDEASSIEAVQACVERFGRIDGLFAVAGGSGRRFGDGPLDSMPLEGWVKTFELNGLPAFLSTREVLKVMLQQETGGSVALVTSVLASSPAPSLFETHAYAAVKGAEIALMTSLAASYASSSIRVNAIASGLVDTPMAQRAASDPEIVAFAKRKQPLANGLLAPVDIAETALFLLSDSAKMITGQTIAVDGGWSVSEGSQ